MGLSGVIVRIRSADTVRFDRYRRLRLREGAPDAAAQEFFTAITIRDTDGAPPGPVPNGTPGDAFVRVHADLAVPIVLAADTDYWIGMSGDGLELGTAFFFGSGEFLDGIVADYSDAVLAYKNDSGHALI